MEWAIQWSDFQNIDHVSKTRCCLPSSTCQFRVSRLNLELEHRMGRDKSHYSSCRLEGKPCWSPPSLTYKFVWHYLWQLWGMVIRCYFRESFASRRLSTYIWTCEHHPLTILLLPEAGVMVTALFTRGREVTIFAESALYRLRDLIDLASQHF